MSFTPKFKIGQTISNKELYTEFRCSIMQGIRPSKATNSLVIVCDHTKSLYDDKWYGNVLHYTGQGRKGDQSLQFAQNPTLAKSNKTGISLFLFEVMNSGQYTYRGPVKLDSEPYQDTQDDEDGNPRKVWMFPLRTLTEQEISKQELDSFLDNRQKKVSKLSLDKLKTEAVSHGSAKSSSRNVKSKVYIRDDFIAEYTKRSANGICELCEQKAPFCDKKGDPYLESHHVVWLSKGGPDTIENTVALCPNCHKKMHVVADKSDIEKLLGKAHERFEKAKN